MSGVSLAQIQFFSWVQQSEHLIDKNGNRCQIQHAYFQGEKQVGNHKIDGYYECNGEKVAIEFQG